MRLTIVQYAGDYREAYRRLSSGGLETYFAQAYSVGFVGSLAAKFDRVSVVAAITDEAYVEELANGVRAVGAGLKPGFKPSQFKSVIAATDPTRIVLTTPMPSVLDWAHRQGIPVLPVLADSFSNVSRFRRLRTWRLVQLLNRPSIRWVGNHGVSACISLAEIGVQREKIVPWDWPHDLSDLNSRPKQALSPHKPIKIVYVGSVTESKGVGDLIRAAAQISPKYEVHLGILGDGQLSEMREIAEVVGMDSRVHFRGRVANPDAQRAMRDCDIVVVPSRHEHPEGLPLTIYEALRSETPVVASDHPMFRHALSHQISAILYPAANVGALAQAMELLIHDRILYESLSVRSHQVLRQLCLPLHWGDLIRAWCSGDPETVSWVERNSLVNLKPDPPSYLPHYPETQHLDGAVLRSRRRDKASVAPPLKN